MFNVVVWSNITIISLTHKVSPYNICNKYLLRPSTPVHLRVCYPVFIVPPKCWTQILQYKLSSCSVRFDLLVISFRPVQWLSVYYVALLFRQALTNCLYIIINMAHIVLLLNWFLGYSVEFLCFHSVTKKSNVFFFTVYNVL